VDIPFRLAGLHIEGVPDEKRLVAVDDAHRDVGREQRQGRTEEGAIQRAVSRRAKAVAYGFRRAVTAGETVPESGAARCRDIVRAARPAGVEVAAGFQNRQGQERREARVAPAAAYPAARRHALDDEPVHEARRPPGSSSRCRSPTPPRAASSRSAASRATRRSSTTASCCRTSRWRSGVPSPTS
jgi:hypothetical protein